MAKRKISDEDNNPSDRRKSGIPSRENKKKNYMDRTYAVSVAETL
jgi:hypothetical protein